jgi:hypothetical protein
MSMLNGRTVIQSLICGCLLTVNQGCDGEHSDEDSHHHDDHNPIKTEENGFGHEHEQAHAHEHEEDGGAEFDVHSGLLVSEKAGRQIGLQTTKISEQRLALQFTATAQVFQQFRSDETGQSTARASAIIPEKKSKFLEVGDLVEVHSLTASGPSVNGRLVRLDRLAARAIGQVEAILEVSDSQDSMVFGSFLEITFRGEEQNVFAIPKSALLDAASGRFAYVKKKGRYLRTPIRMGASGKGFVEIVEGLNPGDEVVSEGVVGLWLMELRFTKGGGHSH